MNISHEWAEAIAGYLAALRVAGRPRTTIDTRRQHLQHFARRIDSGPWAVTGTALVDYADEQEWANETRRGRRATFVSFYEWAQRSGRVSSSPADELAPVRAGEPFPNPVPDDVYLEALIRADEDEAIWIDLAAEHGLRRAEISVMHSDDVVPTLLGHDLIVHGKGGKRRTVPLTRAMARALLERIERQGRGYFWRGADHGHISPRWLGKRINRLLPAPWTIHKLRHRAATRFWIASDGDPYAVADLMGWANLNMVRRYVRQPSDRLRIIVESASRIGPGLRVRA